MCAPSFDVSTILQKAATSSIGASSTLRFVTLKCEDIASKGGENGVYLRVLKALSGGTHEHLDGTGALKVLEIAMEHPPYFVVVSGGLRE